jgi:hypothetical protein
MTCGIGEINIYASLFGSRWKMAVSFTLQPFYSLVKSFESEFRRLESFSKWTAVYCFVS